MKLLFTADIHVDPRHLSATCEAARRHAVDALVIGGDLIPHFRPPPSPEKLLQIHVDYLQTALIPELETLRRKETCRVYLDLGNDDLLGARKVLEARDGDLFHLLHGRKHRLSREVDILGYMNVPPTPFLRKDWEKADTRQIPYQPGNRILREGYVSGRGRIEPKQLDLKGKNTIEADLGQLSETIDRPFIFVSHGPPHDTPLDLLDSGLHVGSRAVRRFIEDWSAKELLRASLHGHIHESPFRSGSIQTRIGSSLCLNPGQAGGPGSALRYVVLEYVDGPRDREIRLLYCPA